MTTNKQHPADGIYFVDYGMLLRRFACLEHRTRWRRFYGHKQIPITMDVLRMMHTPNNRVLMWVATKMYSRGVITRSELDEFNVAYDGNCGRGDIDAQRTDFMDLLAARARREGRLS